MEIVWVSRSKRAGCGSKWGDFNFVALNENALCKEIAKAASVEEVG